MQKFLQHIFLTKSKQLNPDTFNEAFKEWEKPSRQIQISAVSLLTALLYLFFSILSKPWASDQIQSLMLKVHLLIIVPMLFTISFLAYKKHYYQFVMYALSLSPLVSILCHAFIASKLPHYAPFQMEGYMIIFWIFIISGLTFWHALVSAVCTAAILLISPLYFMNQTEYYIMHVFWIFCSFSFGLLGALIFDQSRKAVFVSHLDLHQIAITDPLTGIFNRNQLNNVLNNETHKNFQNDRVFGILILDIDHFKKVNDSLGHDEGDKVLIQTAKLLSRIIYKSDTLIRWGGEEFVIVALEVDARRLIKLSEKLRNFIEQENYGNSGSMTVSIGATLFKENDTQDSLISRADKALYMAKENGRNNSVFIE